MHNGRVLTESVNPRPGGSAPDPAAVLRTSTGRQGAGRGRRRLRTAGAVAGCAALLTAAACSSGGQSYGSMDEVPPNTVIVSGMQFQPQRITVHAGDTVTWEFRDNGVPHDVTSADGNGVSAANPLLDSGHKTRGQYTHTFDDPGTYDYMCTVHPRMTGSVIVEP